MDQLTLDCIAARKAGMTYGKYMALHYKPPVVPVVVELEPEEVPEEMPKQPDRTCRNCGTKLQRSMHGNAMYCSQYCKYESYKRKQRLYYHKKKEREADGKV